MRFIRTSLRLAVEALWRAREQHLTRREEKKLKTEPIESLVRRARNEFGDLTSTQVALARRLMSGPVTTYSSGGLKEAGRDKPGDSGGGL